MGIPPNLVCMISDVIHKPRTRVWINSGYSKWFSLRRGVWQGDPLSCLLYDFSIKPLSMRLCNTLQGVSIRGLPPAKLMMYADDTNLFVDDWEDLALIKWTLDSMADTLGSSFNSEKTIIKPFGDTEFMMVAFQDGTPNTRVFPHATILPPGDPICILGIWVGSPDRAQIRWLQINAHISKLIVQWKSIGTSIWNRALLAKALMQSHCYYLLDRNSMPLKRLLKISQQIQRFVWGPNSCMPYSSLVSPMQLGGVDCPPLTLRPGTWSSWVTCYQATRTHFGSSGPWRILN
jgi:Reverse transcriptase (RNA-dependent DNA polymerase)